MPKQTPLAIYRPFGLRVSDLRDQDWCEKQLEFVLQHGREETAAMQEGSERHQSLHEESIELVEVAPQSREDLWALHLFNAFVGLKQLASKGFCRELPVFGMIGGIWMIGVLDQLEQTETGSLQLSDTKTRQRPTLPTEAQQRASRLQLMLYSNLFSQLVQGRLSANTFFIQTHTLPERSLTPLFFAQMKAIGIPADTLVDLFPLVMGEFQKSPPLEHKLLIRYEWQEDHSFLGEEIFPYQAPKLERQIKKHLTFWQGQRPAQRVSQRERWKCRYCAFQEPCQTTQK